MIDTNEELLAKLFHDVYERLAPEFGYKTREASAVPWEDVPENNKKLMIAVIKEIFPVEAEDFNSILGKVNIILLKYIDELQKESKRLEEQWETEHFWKGA